MSRLDTALGLEARRGPVARIVKLLLYAVLVFVFAGPLVALLTSSFGRVSDPTKLSFIPDHLTLDNYRIAASRNVFTYLLNSLIVVGGGIMGACTAYELARAGENALLLEAGTFADPHAGTAKSAAIVRMHYSNPEVVRMALKSRAAFMEQPRRISAHAAVHRINSGERSFRYESI